MVTFSSLVPAVRANLTGAGIKTSHGHTQQLLAAALGHASLASLQAAGDADQLPEAHHVILDVYLLQQRAVDLGAPDAAKVVDPVVKAFQAHLGPGGQLEGVHVRTDKFVEAVQHRLNYVAVNGSAVAGEMAMTNGGLDEIYLPLDLWETFDVDDEESLEEQVVGHVTVEKDPPGDRAYWGHRIDVEATVNVERLGRRLRRRLAFDHSEILAAALARLRGKVEYTSLPAFLLAEPFTLPQLQEAYEVVLGRPMDKSAFRKRMLDAEFLDEAGTVEGPLGRSAMGYRVKDRGQAVTFPRTFRAKE